MNTFSMIIIFLHLPKKDMPSIHTLRVSSIERNTTDSVVVSFDIPAKLVSSYSFTAGQYIPLEATIEGEVVRRSYSICSAPSSGKLQVGIKELEKGLFSTYANRTLKVGDSLKVGTPEGRFIYPSKDPKQSIVGIAAGSGITPIMSVLKTVLEKNASTQFTLVYGNKSEKETLFYDELIALEKQYTDRLKIHWFFSQSKKEGAEFGRINRSAILTLFGNSVPQHTFYLCGPEGLIQEASGQLNSLGIAQDQLFFELFTSSTDKTKIESSVEKGSLQLTYDEVTHTLELASGKTLLDIALQAKLDVPYSCQGGVCSSCIARVTEGKAIMESNQILTDTEIEEGLVLTCQAIAQSEKIQVDYDDV